MEKHTHHYRLAAIQAQMSGVEEMNLTFTAQAGIRAAGMMIEDALEVVRRLTLADFYKSMTTHKDHRVRQDVITPNGAARGST